MATLSSADHVVVVGSGLAGTRCSEALRRDGFTGAVTLVGDEPHEPYDRPPLSKQVLSGKWTTDQISLVTSERLRDLDVAVRSGAAAVALDVARTTVHLADGSDVAGTFVVVATGSRARQLSFSSQRLHTLRSLTDVQRLVAAANTVAPGSTVIVIGGGFVGAEVATSFAARGLVPVVLEALAMPLLNVVGESVAEWLLPLANDAGVDLRVHQQVSDVIDVDGGYRVIMHDGSGLDAALVVVSVGADPNVEWLATSGLDIRNGLVVSDRLLASPTVAAIGDVARFTWRHDPFVEEVRIEHWQTANDHANALASYLVGATDAPLTMTPYFWSDQYGRKIQMLGHPAPSDTAHLVSGSPEDRKWLAAYSRDGRVTGLVALNQPRGLMMSKPLVDAHVRLDDAVRDAPWSA
jgi:NADPH-dependent 2,4-dienoyl-CoA reductase/sulfur reductase-like enzyme